MSPTAQPMLVTRKDIAALMGVSVDSVRRNEVRWGLKLVRRDLNSRSVRYRRGDPLELLTVRGSILPARASALARFGRPSWARVGGALRSRPVTAIGGPMPFAPVFNSALASICPILRSASNA